MQETVDVQLLANTYNQYSFKEAKSAAVWGEQLANLRQAYMVSRTHDKPVGPSAVSLVLQPSMQ
jgi:hypothetical protein